MPWENWQSWHTYTLILIGMIAAIFVATYIAEKRERKRQKEAEEVKKSAHKPTSREFLVSLDVRRVDLRSNLIQMYRRYEDLEKEITAISLQEGGNREFLAGKVHERAELGEDITKIKGEITKVNKFIREMQNHFSGKPEKDTNASN